MSIRTARVTMPSFTPVTEFFVQPSLDVTVSFRR